MSALLPFGATSSLSPEREDLAAPRAHNEAQRLGIRGRADTCNAPVQRREHERGQRLAAPCKMVSRHTAVQCVCGLR